MSVISYAPLPLPDTYLCRLEPARRSMLPSLDCMFTNAHVFGAPIGTHVLSYHKHLHCDCLALYRNGGMLTARQLKLFCQACLLIGPLPRAGNVKKEDRGL